MGQTKPLTSVVDEQLSELAVNCYDGYPRFMEWRASASEARLTSLPREVFINENLKHTAAFSS